MKILVMYILTAVAIGVLSISASYIAVGFMPNEQMKLSDIYFMGGLSLVAAAFVTYKSIKVK